MIMNIGIEVTEENLTEILNGLNSFIFTITPPGITLYRLIDSVSAGRPLNIVETGCVRDVNPTSLITDGWSSFYLAKWAATHGGKFTTIELDATNLAHGKIFLERFKLSDNVQFVNGESVEEISKLKEKVDVFYLDSCDGVEHGLAEFKAALAHDPILIIMDDFISKAAKAVEYAAENKIPFKQIDRYSVFTPQIKLQ